MSDYKEYLDIAVLQEKRPVNYKSLARSLGIHVNTAKQALYEFSKDQPNVHAIYCVTGVHFKTNYFTIQLVKESELEDAKKTFKTLTGIHVYSVSFSDLNDASLLYAACKNMPKLSLEDRIQYGALKNAHVVQKTASLPPSSKPSTKPVNPAVNNKRKGASLFSTIEKKQAVSKPEKKAPIPKPLKKAKKTDEDEIEKRMAKTTIKATDIFTDDEEEEPAEQVATSHKEDDMMEDVKTIEEKPSQQEPSSPPPPPLPEKLRRQVLKKKTTTNARGLLVTEEVLEWETIDPNEVESKSIKQVKPVENKSNTTRKQPTKTTKKPTAQANLFSFFKKA
ncbi:DNA polymerase subunit Cdc27-domain-containing protein [Gilbertella persicaria]|uniref:DNA polymerase subunit Cdc27-domain-containing protein n=1 Tax=Gilbertella persicaria TaxID=101096 RepID=UPI00221FC179|nr:DNA polymerase subunit Cdc27-domain-containing protein [Gilbertella persicaria]KAI8047712.1 DNA polymerase subunit Cdc27-domain-containing protein [Gilbertella persicaria]